MAPIPAKTAHKPPLKTSALIAIFRLTHRHSERHFVFLGGLPAGPGPQGKAALTVVEFRNLYENGFEEEDTRPLRESPVPAKRGPPFSPWAKPTPSVASCSTWIPCRGCHLQELDQVAVAIENWTKQAFVCATALKCWRRGDAVKINSIVVSICAEEF
jgi:hypothetical protein